MAARQSPWSSLPCASAGGGAKRRRASGARESALAHVGLSLSLSWLWAGIVLTCFM